MTCEIREFRPERRSRCPAGAKTGIISIFPSGSLSS